MLLLQNFNFSSIVPHASKLFRKIGASSMAVIFLWHN